MRVGLCGLIRREIDVAALGRAGGEARRSGPRHTLQFACWPLAGLHGSMCCNVVGSLTSSTASEGRLCATAAVAQSAWRDDIDPCSMFPPVRFGAHNCVVFAGTQHPMTLCKRACGPVLPSHGACWRWLCRRAASTRHRAQTSRCCGRQSPAV
jgi:hypothetical protein